MVYLSSFRAFDFPYLKNVKWFNKSVLLNRLYTIETRHIGARINKLQNGAIGFKN